MRLKKRLGQHFLIRPEIAEQIAGFAELSAEDVVVEIGAGTGILTKALAQKAGKVIAFEIDPDLIPDLQANLSACANVEIIPADFLKAGPQVMRSLDGFKVVANLPYYLTTPILFTLLEFFPRLKSAVLTVQKEVAERLSAKPGTKQYGALTISAGVLSEIKLVKRIKKGAFRPAPKVDSAVIRLSGREKPALPPEEMPLFLELVHSLFTQRRKTILRGLVNLWRLSKNKAGAILSRCSLEKERRPETLTIQDFAALAREMRKL